MDTAPTTEERLDAIEEFLAQLVVLLEVEPEISRESVTEWLQICSAAARAHGTKTPREQAAFGQLCERVLSLEGEDSAPDNATRQATRAALQKAKDRRAGG